ncbi:MAG: hypothetical protein V9E99_05835 [Microthrixaceae bacterium]|jgi:hypothetical protein|nr:DUF4157 domain-containing protein [Actinomycetota bacterium]MBP6728255.1 DUF4157 domain-containing protein [Microthrixaceae bacterium]HMS12312.1 DUF4157 domain-containing protein [Microthrixaceae bacterium]HMT24380.1 DUF4157 domain-containing protein [Microthrixaceae bacterium]HMT59899.1 DUF4157 domain-containing protein [Microthrixaceae bacterium]
MHFERREGYTLWVGGPVPRGAAAITLGHVICIRERYVDDELLVRHELVHVRQWREHGVVGFLRRYLSDYLRFRVRGLPHWAAYRRIGFECEAEWEARSAGPR